jgi:hypothetical protein
MKNKDTQLLEEAYAQVTLTEGLVNTLIVKPLGWVIGKILNKTLSAESKFRFLEAAITASIELFKQYLINRREKDSGTLSPDELNKVEKWEAKYPTPEDFMNTLRTQIDSGFEYVNKHPKYSDYEKQWTIKQLEKLKQDVEGEFKHIAYQQKHNAL